MSPALSIASNSHYGTSLLGFSGFLIFKEFHNPPLAGVLEPLIFIMRTAVPLPPAYPRMFAKILASKRLLAHNPSAT